MQNRQLILGILSLTASLAACSHNDSTPAPPPPTKCQKLIASLPSDYIHGTVTVPEDYADPNGRKIQVFYYGRLGTDPNFPTIVFFNGGPGGSSHSSFKAMTKINDSSADAKVHLPILYIDQRGTGCSTPYLSSVTQLSDLIRLSHYGSTEIVKDAEVVRKTLLGGQKWKVFGQSFGGLISKRYLQVAPEGIRSLHVHGFSSTNDETVWLSERIKAQNRLAQEFFVKYPGDEQVYLKIESLLNDQVCGQSGTSKSCGKPMLYAFTNFLGFHDQWDGIHKVLNVFLKDDHLNQAALNFWAGILARLSEGESGYNPWAGMVISWVDQGASDFSRTTCEKIYDILRKEGDKPETWPLHECKTAMSDSAQADTSATDKQIYQILSYIPHNVLTLDMEVELVKQHPEIPFFLYSGGEDGFVPVETYSPEVAAMGNMIHYTNFPNSGHEGFMTEKQVWADLVNDDGAMPGPVTTSLSPALLQESGLIFSEFAGQRTRH